MSCQIFVLRRVSLSWLQLGFQLSVMLLALALDVRNGVRRIQSSLTSNALSMNRGLL